MKIRILLLAIIHIYLFNAAYALSGFDDYTYQTDRCIMHINQLIGKTFVPQEYMEGRMIRKEVNPGDIQISFSPDAVIFDGVDGLDAFRIVGKRDASDGYEFKLADAYKRDFSMLKVVTDRERHVQAVHFASKRYGDFAFFLPRKTDKDLREEAAYFTAAKNAKMPSFDALKGTTIRPSTLIVDINDPYAVKERVAIKRGLRFDFEWNTLTLVSEGKKEVFNIKKSGFVKCKEENCKLLQLKVGEAPGKLFFMLNENDELQYIQIGNTRFGLD